jgi:cell filamentation protein
MDTPKTNSIFVPNTWTLSNKLGIRDREELSSIELTLSSIRAEEGMPKGNFDYKHLKSIHRHLFQDVYEWAGEERKIETRKHSNKTPFTNPSKIDGTLKESLQVDTKTLPTMSKPDIATTISRLSNAINTAHPFLEGNGRTTREYVNQLVEQTKYRVNWSEVDRKEWNHASKSAFEGNNRALSKLYEAHLVSPDKVMSKQIDKPNEHTLTPQQIKHLYPEMVALADKLDFHNKIKSSTVRSQNMLAAFAKSKDVAAIKQYPELRQYFAIKQKNYDKIDSSGKSDEDITKLKTIVDLKIASAILKPKIDIQFSKDEVER